jgi:hypothetical protein
MRTIDSYRCREYYTQILKNFKLNKRINIKLKEYARKKKVESPNEIKENIH